MEQREKIIEGCNGGIKVKDLAKCVVDGVVSLTELPLTPERRKQVEQILSDYEDSLWKDAQESNTVGGYQKYLQCFPEGKHSDEARTVLASLEDTYWDAISHDLTKEGLEGYEKAFPNGRHVAECRMLLADLPYLEVKKKDTILAYREYLNDYPDRHDGEILARIEEIEDENDWATACANNIKDSYRVYLDKHPRGIHAEEARNRIKNRSGKEIFIEELKNDPNCYPIGGPDGIKTKIDNGVANWDDLLEVFDQSKIDAIKEWKAAAELPAVPDLDRLPEGFAEVYFWGTKGTGKTCVIGSLLGSLCNIKHNYIPIQSNAELHRQRLTNLFSGNNSICTLPDSTITTNLPAMTFRVRDDKQRQHQLMLIDMAGEAFTGIFKSRHGIGMTEDEKKAVEKIDSYLLGKQRNAKIHFFVIEYGGANKIVDPRTLPGITQINVLQDVAAYFQEKGIFQKSTVGVYVVVTKCDKIDCSREERAKKASEYVSTGQMGTFVDNLKNEYAKRARVEEFKKISFSIGDVFAKSLCVFDNRDTEKIIEKLLLKTPWVTGEKLWEKILGWLRYH